VRKALIILTFITITIAMGFFLSCGLLLSDLSSTVAIKNSGNGDTMVITVNGDSKTVNNTEVETWVISWRGASLTDPLTVNVTATYVTTGGLYTYTFVVYTGDNKSLIISNFA